MKKYTSLVLLILLAACSKDPNNPSPPPGGNSPGNPQPPPKSDTCIVCGFKVDTLYTVYEYHYYDLRTTAPVQMFNGWAQAIYDAVMNGGDSVKYNDAIARQHPLRKYCEDELLKTRPDLAPHLNVYKPSSRDSFRLTIGIELTDIVDCVTYDFINK